MLTQVIRDKILRLPSCINPANLLQWRWRSSVLTTCREGLVGRLTSWPAGLSMMRWLFWRSTWKVCRSLLLMPSITVAGSRSSFSTRSSSAHQHSPHLPGSSPGSDCFMSLLSAFSATPI